MALELVEDQKASVVAPAVLESLKAGGLFATGYKEDAGSAKLTLSHRGVLYTYHVQPSRARDGSKIWFVSLLGDVLPRWLGLIDKTGFHSPRGVPSSVARDAFAAFWALSATSAGRA